MTANPFEMIDQRLSNIERLISQINTNQAPAPEPADPFLRVDEVGKILMCPNQTVYQKAALIGYIRHGKRLMFKKSDVLKFLEKYRFNTLDDRRVVAAKALKERATR